MSVQTCKVSALHHGGHSPGLVVNDKELEPGRLKEKWSGLNSIQGLYTVHVHEHGIYVHACIYAHTSQLKAHMYMYACMPACIQAYTHVLLV